MVALLVLLGAASFAVYEPVTTVAAVMAQLQGPALILLAAVHDVAAARG
jgi:hypothetical protein